MSKTARADRTRGEEAAVPTPPPIMVRAVAQQAPPRQESLLEWIEEILIKMILGIFQFILLRLPQEIFEALVRWLPTTIRLIRILVLFCSWMLLVSGPAATTWFMIEKQQADCPWYAWPAAWGYTFLAILGSAWGVRYIKRRRRWKKAQQSAASLPQVLENQPCP